MWFNWSQSLYPIMMETSIRATVLAVVAGLILKGFRVRSSSVRHAVWRGVLATMLLLPVLSRYAPSIPIYVGAPVHTFRIPDGSVVAPDRIFIAGGPSAPPPSPEKATAPTRMFWRELLWTAGFWVYAAGVLILLIRLAAGWIVMRRIAGAGARVEGASLPNAWESSRVMTPLTIGVLFPRIVLPMDWKTWPEEKLSAVMAHERAHVERWDPLAGFLARVNWSLFWFHPAAWWVKSKLAATAEQACDDAVLRTACAPRRYAEVLVEMAENMRTRGGRVQWQGLGVNGNGSLQKRIDHILSGDFRRASRADRAKVAVACASAIVLSVACRQERPTVDMMFRSQIRDLGVQTKSSRASSKRTPFPSVAGTPFITVPTQPLPEAVVTVARDESGQPTLIATSPRVLEAAGLKIVTPTSRSNSQTTAATILFPYATPLQFSAHVDFRKLNEEAVQALISMRVPYNELTFNQDGRFASARFHVHGEIATISGRVVQTFDNDIAVGPLALEGFNSLKTSGAASVWQQSMYLSPGSYNGELTVTDKNTGNVGSKPIFFRTFPYLKTFSTSSLIVADEMHLLPPGTGDSPGVFQLGDMVVHPNLTHEFSDRKDLNLWFEIYDLTANPATQQVAATVDVTFSASGDETQKTFTIAGNTEIARFAQTFPLAQFATGEHSIEIRITDNVTGLSMLKFDRFTVIR
jgi:hypothetical protein